MQDLIDKAPTLLEALTHIQRFRSQGFDAEQTDVRLDERNRLLV